MKCSKSKEKNLNRISKFISLVLRHKPEEINISLDDGGWANVNELCKNMNIELSLLTEIVETDNKNRYSFNNDNSKIRANQGHSINVNLDLTECIPTDLLYHGTPSSNNSIIFEEGIKKMSRHHVHLSEDQQTAKTVGKRRSKKIDIFIIDALKMHNDGYVFYKSVNNVWLCEYIDPKYIIGVHKYEY